MKLYLINEIIVCVGDYLDQNNHNMLVNIGDLVDFQYFPDNSELFSDSDESVSEDNAASKSNDFVSMF